jgi:hypothetical protein
MNGMKNAFTTVIIAAFVFGFAAEITFAQSDSDWMEQVNAIKGKSTVTTGLGDLKFNGYIVNGLWAKREQGIIIEPPSAQNYWDTKSWNDWEIKPVNQSFTDTEINLNMTYTMHNWGFFLTTQMLYDATKPDVYAQNGVGSDAPQYPVSGGAYWAGGAAFGIPYAYTWVDFLDKQMRVSLGKLYSRNIANANEMIWMLPTSFTSFAEEKNQTYNASISLRYEWKPDFLKGLDVGFQWFMTDREGQFWEKPEYGLAEWGFGASYTSELFDAVAGLRTDGPGDGDDVLHFLYSGTNITGVMALEGYYGTTLGQAPSIIISPPTDYDKSFLLSYVYFGGNAKALSKVVPGLSLLFGLYFANLQDYTHFGWWNFDVSAGYNLNTIANIPLSFDCNVKLQGFGPEVDSSDSWEVTNEDGSIKPVTAPLAGKNGTHSVYASIEPKISYQLTPGIGASVAGGYGIMKDVLDAQWSLNPNLSFNLSKPLPGVCTLDIGYKYTLNDYCSDGIWQPWYMPGVLNASGGNAEPQGTHEFYINLMFFF